MASRVRYRQRIAEARKALDVAMDGDRRNEGDIITITAALAALKQP
jgi:hypothetical protein